MFKKLIEFFRPKPQIIENQIFEFAGYTLRKNDMNLVYVPVGKMSKAKSEEYMVRVKDCFVKAGYRVMLIAVPQY